LNFKVSFGFLKELKETSVIFETLDVCGSQFWQLEPWKLFHLSFATKLSRNSSKSDFSSFFEKPISTENVAKLDFRTFRPRSGERVPDVVSDAETQSRQIRKGHCPRRWSQDPVPLVVHFLQVTNHSSVHLYMTGFFSDAYNKVV
jgi:hypothetical protein